MTLQAAQLLSSLLMSITITSRSELVPPRVCRPSHTCCRRALKAAARKDAACGSATGEASPRRGEAAGGLVKGKGKSLWDRD